MNLEKSAHEWLDDEPSKTQKRSEFYCETRDVFQARLDRMLREFLRNGNIDETNVYLASAIAGEIGNNSFDHNLGSWPDVQGIFFGYESENSNVKIILADRGQGVFKTLKKVKSEIMTDEDALNTAFTERISGRAPEKRGNGLKFVKENVEDRKMHLLFSSGNAQIEINAEMKIGKSEKEIRGCLAILTL